MNAQIIQTEGGLLFQLKLDSFPSEADINRMIERGIKECTAHAVDNWMGKNLDGAMCVKVKTAAELLSIKTVATVRGYAELPVKHPKYLPIIPGESALGDMVRLVDLTAWCARNSKHDAADKIREYQAKNAKK